MNLFELIWARRHAAAKGSLCLSRVQLQATSQPGHGQSLGTRYPQWEVPVPFTSKNMACCRGSFAEARWSFQGALIVRFSWNWWVQALSTTGQADFICTDQAQTATVHVKGLWGAHTRVFSPRRLGLWVLVGARKEDWKFPVVQYTGARQDQAGAVQCRCKM